MAQVRLHLLAGEQELKPNSMVRPRRPRELVVAVIPPKYIVFRIGQRAFPAAQDMLKPSLRWAVEYMYGVGSEHVFIHNLSKLEWKLEETATLSKFAWRGSQSQPR
jgi:hypothetical protein